MAYHRVMTKELCKHDDGKPVHSNGECQAHYRQTRRRERGLQKPGPKPDPAKPFSRYGGDLSHHGKRAKCGKGHWFDGVDDNGKQTCSICDEVRRTAPCPAGHDYTFKNRHGSCRECARLRQPAVNRMAKYGITPEQLEQMLIAQNFTCAICPKKFDLEAKRPFAVDHDHACCPAQRTCGKCLRKLLCDECNNGLGRFKDSISILQSAIEYLETHYSAESFGELNASTH